MEIEPPSEDSDSCLVADLGVRLLLASFIRPLPKLVEDEAEGGSREASAGEWVGGKGGVDWEREKFGETGVLGREDSEVRETKELFVGGLKFSFGGGIGGEFLEEPAANLKTLREAKREDDEADCFWADPELPGVAIAFGMRKGGKVGCTDEGQRLAGVVREGPCLPALYKMTEALFRVYIWFCLGTAINSFPRYQEKKKMGHDYCYTRDIRNIVTLAHLPNYYGTDIPRDQIII